MTVTTMSKPQIVQSASRDPRSRQKQALDKWIEEAICDPDKSEPCKRIVLVHMFGTSQREIHTVTIGTGSGKDPKMMGALFKGKAESYAQDLPGVQTFNLLAFYGSESEPSAFHPFTLTGDTFHPGLATEAPDSQGLVQMLMRHYEVDKKLQVQERVAATDTLMQMIDFLSKALVKSQEENSEAFAIMKEIMLEKTLNAHDLRMKEMAFARTTGEREKLMKIAPALVNQISGKEVFPQSTVDSAILEGIVENVDFESIQKIVGSGGKDGKELPPELVGMLLSRMTEIQEKKNKEAARMKMLAAEARVTTLDGEADAAGDVTE